MKKIFLAVLSVICVALLASIMILISIARQNAIEKTAVFDADRAYKDVQVQLSFGPRTPGSDAHQKAIDYFTSELKKAGWKVEIQSTSIEDHEIHNIIAKRGSGSNWVILGAHYDSRLIADQGIDPALAAQPVVGANDGASGAAVLLELARALPNHLDNQIWLVFFDAEDQGNLAGWNWILGSKAFVNALSDQPDAAVIVDMIGDKDLNIYREEASSQPLVDDIWSTASQLGYEQYFINTTKYNILDDHIPFLEAGIPAIDIIDFDYSYWHTSEDTIEHISPESLQIVGDVLLNWLIQTR